MTNESLIEKERRRILKRFGTVDEPRISTHAKITIRSKESLVNKLAPQSLLTTRITYKNMNNLDEICSRNAVFDNLVDEFVQFRCAKVKWTNFGNISLGWN